MKKIKLSVLLLGLVISGFTFQSCSDDDDNCDDASFPNALVTVKSEADGSCFLQLDDSTTLYPVNMAKSPYSKEVRALTNFKKVEKKSDKYTYSVYVNWLDSILTKNMVASVGDKDDTTYGNDPVEIVNDWVTIAEDGYLTLRFRTRWGNYSTHIVNLVASANPDKPYEIVFRHNANGDRYGYIADGLVAFKLDKLPDTNGKTVDLTLKWNSFSGEKSVVFKYCTHKATNANALNSVSSSSIVKSMK